LTPPLVLVVEDDDEVRRLIEVTMRMQEWDVVGARDGLEGLVKLEFRSPSVVILDVMMPNVSGDRMLSQMRSDERLQSVPVVIVTGRADAHATFDGLVGAANVFPKPFNGDALVARVAELIGHSAEER
jgi:DNA-binding response OmpR family regulator